MIEKHILVSLHVRDEQELWNTMIEIGTHLESNSNASNVIVKDFTEQLETYKSQEIQIRNLEDEIQHGD